MPAALAKSPDLVHLQHLDEANIINSLSLRFMEDDIYVSRMHAGHVFMDAAAVW